METSSPFPSRFAVRPGAIVIAAACLLLMAIVSAPVVGQQAAGDLAQGPAPLGVPIEGPPFRANLSGAAEEPPWQLQFSGADARREIAAEDLAVWGGFVDPSGGTQLILAGGGVIALDDAAIENELLVGTSPVFQKVKVPLRLIAGIILQPPADRARYDQLLERVLSLGGQSDRVILDNGDELTGTISALGAKLQLEGDVGTVHVDRDKLTAVIFNPILIDQPKLSGLRANVGFRDGSRVTAISMFAHKSAAQLKLPGGAVLTAPSESIVALQPLGGRADYLSDLKPASYRHIPFLDLEWPYRADRNVQGGLLRAGGTLYPKGLGMHSPSRITYQLDRAYRRFDALVAIDAATGPRGSAVFRVFTDDGSGAWTERAKSEVMRGGDPPVPISVDLAGARRISLLVDMADRGDEQDHADWLNARLVPAAQ